MGGCRMKTSRFLAAAVSVAGLLGVASGSAGADPVNAKKAELLTMVCDSGLGTLQIATNGNGQWTPGLVTTSTQVGIPYEFHISGSFTPTGGVPETFTEDFVKRAPRHGRLATCTFGDSG